MTARVVPHPGEDVRVCFDASQEGVAGRAERSTHGPCRVVVVNEQISGHAADEAASALRGFEFIYLFRRHAVLALVAGAQILRLRGFGILSPPLAKTFVPSLSVRDSVGAVPLAGAGAALRSRSTPVGERRVGEFEGTNAACDHASTMPCSTDMLDQPCHADVLLELANADGAD